MTAKITRLDTARRKRPTPTNPPVDADEYFGGLYAVLTETREEGERDDEGRYLAPGESCGLFQGRFTAHSRAHALHMWALDEGYRSFNEACRGLGVDGARVTVHYEGRLRLERDPQAHSGPTSMA